MRKFGRRAGLILCCMLLLATPVAAAWELVPGGQVIGIELLDGKVCIGAFDDTLGGPARQAGLQASAGPEPRGGRRRRRDFQGLSGYSSDVAT